MICLEVRDRLVERSLGALHHDDVRQVDRHLAWCAACRKEAGELDRAAATFAFALAPVAPEPDLEDRVLAAVHAAAEAPASRRRTRVGRAAVASAVAAAVAVTALGWGVAMAGRAERFRERVVEAESQQSDAIRRVKNLVGTEIFAAPGNRAFLGSLAPTAGEVGGGSALTWVSPTITDFAMVTVAGLPPGNGLPYRIWIVNETSGQRLPVGEPIRRLDADGGAMRVQDAPDLSAFGAVVVTDAAGGEVLRGTIDSAGAAASPAP